MWLMNLIVKMWKLRAAASFQSQTSTTDIPSIFLIIIILCVSLFFDWGCYFLLLLPNFKGYNILDTTFNCKDAASRQTTNNILNSIFSIIWVKNIMTMIRYS